MDGGDQPLDAQDADFGRLQQPLGGVRRGAVAVGQFGPEVVELLLVAQSRETAVDLDAQLLARHVVARQVGRPGQIDVHLDGGLRRLVLQLPHGVFEQLAVHLVADGGDVPRLLRAEDVAGPANLEVAHADLEARAQLAELLDRLEPLLRRRRDHLVRIDDEVGVGPQLGPADAAAELVQVGEAVDVGLVDDDGVGVGNIEAALDDRRGDQDVGLLLDEGDHRLFQLRLGHLPVGNRNLGVRHDVRDLGGDVLDVVDAVVHEVDLPAAVQLAVDGMADQFLVPADDPRLDRQPVRRRGFEVRDFADAQERRVQRPRDRRRRHRQDIDAGAQELQPLLVLDAEALLLVDDDEAEVFELHVLRNHAVGADEDIDAALCGPLQDRLLLPGAAEAAEHFDGERVLGEPLGEGAEVLLGQHRRGHQDGDLLAVVDGLERGPHGDLGLAVAHVAAQQPVHRLRLLLVPLDLGDGAELVGRFLVRERVLELALPVAVGRQRVAGQGRADRLNLDHVGGHVAQGLADALLLALPRRAAEFRQLRLHLRAADVALHQIDARRRHVQADHVAEFEDEIFF